MSLAVLTVLPWLAAVIAMGFFWLGYRYQRRLLWLIGGLWLLYSVYESLMYLRVLCSGECNIRVDLLLIYPMLLIFTLLPLAMSVSRRIWQALSGSH